MNEFNPSQNDHGRYHGFVAEHVRTLRLIIRVILSNHVIEIFQRADEDDLPWRIKADWLHSFDLTVADFHAYFVAANDNAEPV